MPSTDTPQGTDELLTSAQVRAMTGLSRATMFRRRREGRFPSAVSINERGTRIRFRRSEIEEWVSGLERVDVVSGIAEAETANGVVAV